MRRPLSRSWLFFSLFLLSAFNILPLHAKPAAAPPIAVSVEKAFDYSANGARVPLRVKLENTTGSDRKATLQFHEGWNGNRRTSHTYPFFIPARESVHAVVYPLLSYNLVYEVKENHEGASPIPTDTEHWKMVAVIQEGTPADWHLLSESSYNAAVSSCDLMKWPADYRMYEGQTCLIIPEKTYRTHFDEAHRKAIRQWVTGGGNLWLIGDRGLSVSTRLLGNGRILHVPSLDGLPEEEKKLKLEEFINLHEKGNCYPEITSAAPYYFSAPSTTLGLGLIIFAVLVGPLSLFLWAPAGKRQRLFLLIPAISVGFSLLLLLLILAGDGTGGTGSREVLIQVNPQDHSALISQNQICKTSVLLNNTFQLPENAGITGARMSKARGSIKEKPIEGAARQGVCCRCSSRAISSRGPDTCGKTERPGQTGRSGATRASSRWGRKIPMAPGAGDRRYPAHGGAVPPWPGLLPESPRGRGAPDPQQGGTGLRERNDREERPWRLRPPPPPTPCRTREERQEVHHPGR